MIIPVRISQMMSETANRQLEAMQRTQQALEQVGGLLSGKSLVELCRLFVECSIRFARYLSFPAGERCRKCLRSLIQCYVLS